MKALDPVGDASYSLITRNLWKDTPGQIFFLYAPLHSPITRERRARNFYYTISVAFDEGGQG